MLSSPFRLFLSHSPFHHLVLEQTAFDSAIVERGPLGCGKADELGQSHVGAEQVGAPAAELFLQYVAELGVKLRQCLLLAKTHAVRRVGDDNAFVCRRGKISRTLARLRLTTFSNPAAVRLARAAFSTSPDKSLP